MKKIMILFCLALMGCQNKTAATVLPSIRWIDNQWESAQLRAKMEKKPLLIEFSAPWCIYCNIAEATILHASDLVRLTEKFVAVRFDIDQKINRGVVNQFQEVGIPLFVTADASGKEFSRLTDPSVETFKNFLLATLGSKEMAPLAKKFYLGMQADFLGHTKEAGILYAEAKPYFVTNPGWELATLLRFQLEKESKVESGIEFLKTFADQPGRPFVWAQLAELQKSEAAKLFYWRQAWQELERDLTPEKLANPNYQVQELDYLEIKPELSEHLGLKNKKEIYREIATVAKQRAESRSQPFLAKPYWMRAISWSVEGDAIQQAITLAKACVKQYPDEVTFYSLLAKSYAKEKSWDLAMDAQRQAVAKVGDAAKNGATLRLANYLAQKGSLAEAIATLKSFTEGAETNSKLAKREEGFVNQAKQQIKEWELLQSSFVGL